MKNSKLILLFSELTTSEMKHFEDFVQSPVFNKSEQVSGLLKILKTFAADFHINLLTKKRVSEQLFPHKKGIEEKGLSVAMTKLTKLLEQFLAFQKYQKNENLQENYLLEALLERNQDKFVGQHLEKMSKKRAVQKEKSVDFYTDEFVFLQQKHRYNLRQTKKKQVFEVPNILQNIDIFYALNKLKYACYIVNRKNIYKNETALDDIDNLLKNIEKQHFYENKALEIYFFCFKMLETEDEVYFEKLKNLLEKKGSILTENELKNIYALALNFCNKKVRNGENYYHKMLAIYLMMLEKGFLQDGKYTYHKYIKNIVTTALKAEEFELAKEITIVYKTKVEPKFRKTLFCLNIGAYHFYRKEFEQAADYFTKIEGVTIDYEINRRNLLFKLYYEMNNELFAYEADNFQHFMRNNKAISEKLKKGHLNFISIALKLNQENNKIRRNKARLATLIQKIERVSPISDKSWLLFQAKKML